MSENLIERYLADLGEIRGTRANVPETSFYPALERLLSDIGKTLSPKVGCVINLANRGAGQTGALSIRSLGTPRRGAGAPVRAAAIIPKSPTPLYQGSPSA